VNRTTTVQLQVEAQHVGTGGTRDVANTQYQIERAHHERLIFGRPVRQVVVVAVRQQRRNAPLHEAEHGSEPLLAVHHLVRPRRVLPPLYGQGGRLAAFELMADERRRLLPRPDMATLVVWIEVDGYAAAGPVDL
jgi:hypothetical protein